MMKDRYGLALSTASAAAREAYVDGVDRLLAAGAGAADAFARSAEADPGFALAHAGHARALALLARPGEARDAAARARERARAPRERGHVEALALAIEGRSAAAFEATRAHLAEYPRDAMVLAPATGVFGLIGFSGRPGREEELLAFVDGFASHYGDDWWFRGAHAFAAVEAGRTAMGRRLSEQALRANPDNGNAAHARAHVEYEEGADAAGLAFLEGWLPGYPRQGNLHCHLAWHLALFHLGQGDAGRAWQIYERDVAPGASWGPPQNTLVDSAAFIWRAELAGAARDPERWRPVAAYGREAYPRAGLTFADVHCALAYAAAGEGDALAALTRELRDAETGGRLPAGPVAPALAAGWEAFARGDWDAAVAILQPTLVEHVRIGGSRAQRDVVEHTLLAAYLRAGRAPDARRVLDGRGRRATVPVAGLAATAGGAAAAEAAPAQRAELDSFRRFIFNTVDQLVGALEGLSERELNWRPAAPSTNSLCAIAVHVMGNAEENILGTVCGRTVTRRRQLEFEATAVSAAPVRERWRALRTQIEAALAALPAGELDRERLHPRRGPLTGRDVLIVVARHAAEHWGEAQLTLSLMRATPR